MSDTVSPVADPLVPPAAPSPPPAGRAAPADLSAWRPLPAAARGIAQGGGALTGAILGVPLYFALLFPWLQSWTMHLVAFLACPLVLAALGFRIATRRWASTSWRLDDRGLQVRRGNLFHREVFVPRARVQHLDLERGPIERHFGLATIVVHTAGTRLHAVRQSGLPEADAVALRDALVPVADTDDDAT